MVRTDCGQFARWHKVNHRVAFWVLYLPGTKQNDRLNASTSQLLNIAADLNAAGKTVTVKRLKTRHARKGETMQRHDGYGHLTGVGAVRKGDGQTASHATGSGKGGTITKVTGLGRQWKGDKDANARRYAEQVRKDRIAARQDRLMEDIDALLKTL